MKFPIFALASGLTLAIATALPSSRLAAEWFVPSESSGKQFALVDQASGLVKLVTVGSDGIPSFRQPLSTGISNVSDIAGARFGSDEVLTVTSPDSNRVAMLLTNTTVPVARTLQGFSGIGVSGLAEIRSGAASELSLASIYQGGTSSTRLESVGTPSTAPALLGIASSTLAIRSMEPFRDPGAGTTVSIYRATSGPNTAVGVMQRSGLAMVTSHKITFGGDLHIACDVATIAAERILVGYRTNSTGAHLVRVSLPVTTASTFSNTTISLPYLVSSVLPILNGGAGNLTDGILLIAADGSRAEAFQVNATATALVATGQIFTPSGGQFITGLLPLPGIGLVKLLGPSPTGASTSYETLIWNGAAWETAATGLLPTGAPSGHNFATLLYYSDNPLANEGARLLGIQDAPDWTRRSSLPDPVPTSVLRESFISAVGGLGSAVTQTLNPPTGTNYVVTNQVEDGLSISALTGRTGSLFTPSLTLTPVSGTYSSAFQISAIFDESRYELLWRQEPSGFWAVATDPLAVSYSINLQFRLRDLSSGISGEIVHRSYVFDAATVASQDSDGDGVPDYVELSHFLDPFGGPDDDADGVSDLAELIANTDPSDSLDFPAEPADIGTGSGMEIVAVARHAIGTEMANGEEIDARSLDGSLLARAPVAVLAAPLPDGGARGATLRSDHSIPQEQLIALSAPLYFDLTNGTRNGREIIRLVQANPPPAFSPVFSPTGGNLATDAAGWVAAAQTAAASYHHVLARTLTDPKDSAVSVLVEQLIHDGLAQVRPLSDPLPALADFTLFSNRSPDLAKTTLSEADLALLATAGFDLPSALSRAEVAKPSLLLLANNVYNRHISVGEATPGMELPFDALRTLLRDGTSPSGYADVVTPVQLASARAAYNAAVASLASLFRPVETWTVQIPVTSAGTAVYPKLPSMTSVILLGNAGDRFPLEQGLGLAAGSQFLVTGFTDTDPIGGLATMQVTAVAVASLPTASDRDSDANLLDDEWELFFFGAIGQNPYAPPASGTGTLLQYFLDGLDPRGTEVPGIPADLSPSLVAFQPVVGGGYTLDFSFAAAYRDYFDFIIERTTTLGEGSFAPVVAPITSLGGDLFRATIPAAEAPAPKAFFRIRVQLK